MVMTAERLSYNEREVSAMTGIKLKTLQSWRQKKHVGPRWVRAGEKLIFYPAKSLMLWLESQPGGGGQ